MSSTRKHAPSSAFLPLALGALGVVYGDIGTSPLYTLHECTTGDHGAPPTPENIFGVLSLIFWALTLVVTVKYLAFVMRADNHGEGGILALLALVPEDPAAVKKRGLTWVALLVLAGAALLYGDGMITPAISVLSAVEGLGVATSALQPLIVPLSCVILVGLFAIQSRGTGKIGVLFGPVMLAWFATIGALGAYHIARRPEVLAALSPLHGVEYFARTGLRGVPILGSVVLAVTGGEALYADMGHFSARPIRAAWLALVMPALVLCYFGQGALMLGGDPHVLENPFFAMVPPGPPMYLLVILSTLATIIASQALISGAFSLTHQAVQLGMFPRVTIRHTSHEAEGQLYIPEINWGLAIACILLVLAFRSSSGLAAAYGIAVSGTMAITSVVYFVVTRRTWGWSLGRALPLLLLFLSFDIPFFAANLFKFADGGYIPIAIGAVVFTVMVNWKSGRSILREHFRKTSKPLEVFVREVPGALKARVPGVGVFLSSSSEYVPQICQHHVARIGVLHAQVLFVTLETEHVPVVEPEDRIRAVDLGNGFYQVVARFGFMERPRAPEVLAFGAAKLGLTIPPSEVTYYIGREHFVGGPGGEMGRAGEVLFDFLSRNARNAADHLAIPPEQVVEMGLQIDL